MAEVRQFNDRKLADWALKALPVINLNFMLILRNVFAKSSCFAHFHFFFVFSLASHWTIDDILIACKFEISERFYLIESNSIRVFNVEFVKLPSIHRSRILDIHYSNKSIAFHSVFCLSFQFKLTQFFAVRDIVDICCLSCA